VDAADGGGPLLLEVGIGSARLESAGQESENFSVSIPDSRQESTGADLHAASVDTPDSKETDHSEETRPVSSAIPFSMNFEDSSSSAQQVRGSFTLDKQHTYATASAAGLPIINDKNKLPDSHTEEILSPPNILSERKTDSEAVMLTNILQLHQGGSAYTIASQKQPIPTDVKELRVNLRSFITSLQSESVDMEREAKTQRLKLYQPSRMTRSGEVSRQDQLSSTSVVVQGAAMSTSEPVVVESNAAGLMATVSLPALHNNQPPRRVMHFQRNPASSLEQFERDEFLIQLQASPENLLRKDSSATPGRPDDQDRAGTKPHSTVTESQDTKLPSIQPEYHPPMQEQTPDITEKCPKIVQEVPANPWIKALGDQNVGDDQVMECRVQGYHYSIRHFFVKVSIIQTL
jgi:hypothetical protein